MSWVIKILERDVNKVEKVWNGSNWVDTVIGPADYVINEFQLSESTWREVSYDPVGKEDVVQRRDLSNDLVMSSASKRYQFINPLIEEINLILPDPPQFNERYLIKNLSEINNKIHVKGKVGGDTLFTLDSTNEVAILFHDGIDFHISI